MLICADDGWTADWSDGVPQYWNYKGCRKYQNLPIYCLDTDECLRIATPNIIIINPVEMVLWRIVNSPKRVSIEFTDEVHGAMSMFKSHLLEALENGDDLLTQFQEVNALKDEISAACCYADLREIYHSNGWN